MKVLSGPQLATAISSAQGLGFLGPGAKPVDMLSDLAEIQKLITSSVSPSLKEYRKTDPGALPIGVGFQTWTDDLKVAVKCVEEYRPCAAWLFAPRNGQTELEEWSIALRKARQGIQIWIQIGTVTEAIEAAKSPHKPDVLVVQGSDAGGHGRATDGSSLIILLPEIADVLEQNGTQIPLVAAGGIADGRGAGAAICLGAIGVVMGTRFLAATEARISKGYQDEVVRASNGALSTLRTQLYNHLRGTMNWPEDWSPRTIWNRSWIEHKEGRSFEELKAEHDDAVREGKGWGVEGRTATYAGTNVGLIKEVKDAREIVEEAREDAKRMLKGFEVS